MAREMPVIAYFRARQNAGAPLFIARFDHDADQMRKHADFFECDKDGNGLKGEVSLPKFVPGEVEVEPVGETEVEAEVSAPAPKSVFSLDALQPKTKPAKKK